MPLDLSRLNVLIADDSAPMRSLIKQLLHAFGIKNIRECSDGSDALQEMRSFPADVIITDWAMEPVDGMDLTRLLRTAHDSPNPFIPIIMLSGHTERHRIMEARDAGINEFLAKPISASALHSRIELIIEQPRPFVRTKKYTGPDRRRKQGKLPPGKTPQRSNDTPDMGNPAAAAAGLQQDDIDKLLAS